MMTIVEMAIREIIVNVFRVVTLLIKFRCL